MIVSGPGRGKVVGSAVMAEGAEAALLIPVAYVVQVKSAAWCVKHADRMMGTEAAGSG